MSQQLHPRSSSKKNEHVTTKSLVHVPSSLTCNSAKLETMQMSVHR